VLRIDVVHLDPDLPLPTYAKPGDAGADLVSRIEITVAPRGGRAVVPTGVRVAIPEGFAGFVLPRSVLALKHGITMANSPGLIDSGYRDELCAIVVNTDPTEPYTIRRGDRVAQLVVQRVEHADFSVVDELPASDRGTGRFGHSGY